MEAIRTLAIRGAPALGVAGAYGVALGAHTYAAESDGPFAGHLDRVVEDIAGTRPTAVNLAWAARLVRAAAEPHANDPDAGARAVLAAAQALAADNDRRHRQLAAHGASLIEPGAQVLHHCNTGPLATGAGFRLGSGRHPSRPPARRRLGVGKRDSPPAARRPPDHLGIGAVGRSLHPHYGQHGGPLHAARRRGDAVLVGADRIAANGDVANKIGTYTMAQLARAHGLPFIVAAPLSTVDFDTATGADIPIEERGADEVRGHGAARWAPGDAPVANPAFDVTPNELVSAIVTERGVARAPFTRALAAWRAPVDGGCVSVRRARPRGRHRRQRLLPDARPGAAPRGRD